VVGWAKDLKPFRVRLLRYSLLTPFFQKMAA
jgi:hypothetical protein